MISKEDVRKLAALARIKLAPEEEDAMAKDMESILGYVTQIQEVSSVAETRKKETVRNVFRNDADPHESGWHTDALLAEAPSRQGNYVKVKNIL